MASEHSKGPWAEDALGPIQRLEVDDVDIFDATGAHVAVVVTADHFRRQADAHLIASAPDNLRERNELLEALEARIGGMSCTMCASSPHVICDSCIEAQRLISRVRERGTR